jgi:selenocysteine lyase/cysteine desulfurase
MEVVKVDGSLELPGADWNAKLLKAIDKDTAVVLVPSVHWMTGLRFQLEAIGDKCASVGAAFLVDGTQSVGALPIDVKKCQIDALICAGYKWLMGPYGMALGYIAEKFHSGKPLEESWMNRKYARNFGDLTKYSMEYAEGAGRYNVCEMSHFILMPMMEAALDQILAWSPEGIQQYTGQLVLPLLDYFKERTVPIETLPYFSSHLFGIKLPKELSAPVFKSNLEEAHVFLSQRGAFIRIALHLFNTTEDIATLIDVFEKTYHNGTK